MNKDFLRDDFLSICFGIDVFKLKKKIETFDFLKNLKKSYFIYSKTLKKSNYLVKNGFIFIDQLITFKGRLKKLKSKGKIEFRLAKKRDLPEIQRIAVKNMKLDRFHFDNRINNSIARKIKIKWIKNYFNKKRGTHLFVSLKNKKIVGFCLIFFKIKEKLVIIDLISVDKKFQTKGIGYQMFNSINKFFKAKSLLFFVGSYQKNNKAINFYKKIGLSIYKKEYIYHYLKYSNETNY